SPEEIAKERGVQSTTIYSHIARLYIEDKIKDISVLVSPTQIEKIRQSLSVVKSTDKLKPIYEGANGEVPYHLIRLALAHIEKETVHLQP
ncbi:MAG: helix-turn-helix domain-containing protein, partial [Flavobacteriales bacterium]